MTKVALTGADGNMGRILRRERPKHGVNLRSAGGRTPLVPHPEDEDLMHGDLRDPAIVDQLLGGVDVLLYMAGTSVERPLPEIIENNLVAEAAPPRQIKPTASTNQESIHSGDLCDH